MADYVVTGIVLDGTPHATCVVRGGDYHTLDVPDPRIGTWAMSVTEFSPMGAVTYAVNYIKRAQRIHIKRIKRDKS